MLRRTLVALAIVCAAGSAFADAYDEAMSRAVVARDKALDSGDPGSWEDALRAFEDAAAIHRTKEALFEVARAAGHLHADDVAFAAYEAALSLGLAGKARDEAVTFLEANAARMARLMVVGPAGAEVEIATHRRGILPLAQPIVVFAGPVRVRVKTSDGRRVDADVNTVRGTPATLDVSSRFVAPKPRVVTVHLAADRGPALRLGTGLLIAGGATLAVSLSGFFVSNYALGKRREGLASRCFQPIGTDECEHALPENVSAAQDDVNAIETWKNVRLASGIGIGVGALLSVGGVIRLLTVPPASRGDHVAPLAAPYAGGLVLGLQGTF